MNGSLGILNVGAGDTKLSFDKSNPAERARAAKIVADMLKRGYAILVQVGEKEGKPLYQRAHAFNEETCEYIIAGGPDETVEIGELLKAEQHGSTSESEKAAAHPAPGGGAGRRKRGRPPGSGKRAIPAERTRAISVGRTAGG